MTNAQRYAHGSKISVRARITGSVLTLEVVDDGIGGAVERDALGIQGLRDRVEATGGRFAVQGEPGRGTGIFARIPPVAVEPAD